MILKKNKKSHLKKSMFFDDFVYVSDTAKSDKIMLFAYFLHFPDSAESPGPADYKTGLCTRLLGVSPDDWALHLTTGLTTELCTRLPGFAPDYWVSRDLPEAASDLWNRGQTERNIEIR